MSAPVLFQALPPLSPEEYRDLEASILANGVRVPVLTDERGVVIDGTIGRRSPQCMVLTARAKPSRA